MPVLAAQHVVGARFCRLGVMPSFFAKTAFQDNFCGCGLWRSCLSILCKKRTSNLRSRISYRLFLSRQNLSLRFVTGEIIGLCHRCPVSAFVVLWLYLAPAPLLHMARTPRLSGLHVYNYPFALHLWALL